MNWIKLPSDDMPAFGTDVLLWIDQLSHPSAPVDAYACKAYLSSDGIWMRDNGESMSASAVRRITHWARIEPPTE